MPEVWIIAANTFREILRRKVIYVLLLLGILMIVVWLGQTSVMNMASEAGEPEILLQMKTTQTRLFFGMWSSCTAFLGLFLGAVALATEIRTQTIVPVLVRSIPRWAYLVGKWLGTQLFVSLLLGLGIGIGLAIIWAFELELRPLFWLSMLAMLGYVTLYTGVSLGLSVVLNPILAGGVTLLLANVPNMIELLFRHPHWALKGLAAAVYHLCPAQMPTDLLADSFEREPLQPDYSLYARVIVENVLYSMTVLLAGCILFSRQEIKLK